MQCERNRSQILTLHDTRPLEISIFNLDLYIIFFPEMFVAQLQREREKNEQQ